MCINENVNLIRFHFSDVIKISNIIRSFIKLHSRIKRSDIKQLYWGMGRKG